MDISKMFSDNYNGFYHFDIYQEGDSISLKLMTSANYSKPVIRALWRQTKKEGLWIRYRWYGPFPPCLGIVVATKKDVRRFKSLINYMNGKRFMSIFYHVGKEGRR